MEMFAMCCTPVPQDFKMFEKTIFKGITESVCEEGSVNIQPLQPAHTE